MAAPNQDRGRTNPDDSSDDDQESVKSEHSNTFSQNASGRYRARVKAYKGEAQYPTEPLYKEGEVVYLAVAGQQQPAGPYIVVSIASDGTYTLKRKDNNQQYPSPVSESSLRVPA